MESSRPTSYDYRSIRIWKYVTLIALFISSLSFFVSVLLYESQHELSHKQQVQIDKSKKIQLINCMSNRNQDETLAGLMRTILKRGVHDPIVRRTFEDYVKQVQTQKDCPPPVP